MKSNVFVLVLTFQCIILIHQLECFKFHDSDLIPERFIRKNEGDHELLKTANLQKSYYDIDHHNSKSYQKTLDTIKYLNDNNDNNHGLYSEELYLDDFIPDDADEDEDQINYDENDNEELETHSSVIAGHQYVSGGAGEGDQHLKPNGLVKNKEEVKSDEDLPAYCDPPNPCPVGYKGDDCDKRPYYEFTADYSKYYQEQQNCMCDDDHNDCQKSTKAKSIDKMNNLIASANVDVRFFFILTFENLKS
jgi:hypothetical protein